MEGRVAPRGLPASGQPEKVFHPHEEAGRSLHRHRLSCVARLMELDAPRRGSDHNLFDRARIRAPESPEQIRAELEDGGGSDGPDGRGAGLAGEQ